MQEKIKEILWLQHLRTDKEAQAIEIAICKKDPWYWLTHWVWTIDAHNPKPIQQFPAKPYLKRICEIWQEQQLLAIPKSRQLMLSWIIVALYLHDAQFKQGRLNIFQSQKQEDAIALLDRAKFMLQYQPNWLIPKCYMTTTTIRFPSLHSEIQAVPQGEHQVRGKTLSGILIDEAAFQPEAEQAYTAIKPAIDGGGKVTMVSTANPGFFEKIVNDRYGKE